MSFWGGGMLNVLLSFAMLFGTVNTSEEISKIEKVEYNAKTYDNQKIDLNIYVKTNKRDILQIIVYFYNKNNELIADKYYSSSLVVDGKKETRATIPILSKKELFLNIIFYSGNLDREIENIMFPIYSREFLSCDLNKDKICESNNPVIVVYENKNILEIKEKISLVNSGLDFNSFNNLVPINKIKLISNVEALYDYGFLKLEKNVNDFDVYYDGGYIFNLKINSINGIMGFNISDNYYVNFFEGKTSQNYINDALYINEILLPYNNTSYSFIVELNDVFTNFSSVKVRFVVNTKGNLIGKCDSSKYCLRRNYL